MKKFYTVSEAAALSKVSPARIRAACQNNEFDADLVGKTYIFTASAFNVWLDAYEQKQRDRKRKPDTNDPE